MSVNLLKSLGGYFGKLLKKLILAFYIKILTFPNLHYPTFLVLLRYLSLNFHREEEVSFFFFIYLFVNEKKYFKNKKKNESQNIIDFKVKCVYPIR